MPLDSCSDATEELTREVYARFGLAYYFSEVLHRGLCNAFVLGTFADPSDVTRPRIEEKLSQAFSYTLGKLSTECETLLPPALFERLEKAIEQRNFLAHHFWFERIPLMSDEAGLQTMLEELDRMVSHFRDIDKELENYFKPTYRSFGITEEKLQLSLTRVLPGTDEKLPAKRSLNKRERIVHAWDVPTPKGFFALTFEAEDGSLLQLCDVGLGWSRFHSPELGWQANKHLEQHLPAEIVTRPTVSRAWNYDLTFSTDATMWVKRGKQEKSFRWGLKARPRRGA